MSSTLVESCGEHETFRNEIGMYSRSIPKTGYHHPSGDDNRLRMSSGMMAGTSSAASKYGRYSERVILVLVRSQHFLNSL